MNRLTIVISTAVLVFNFSCKSNGTDPEEKKSVRDYTWTIDTLAYEGSSQTLMRSIWGSSASDIYVCGHNSGSDGSLWHYGGNSWKDVKLFDFIQRGSFSLTTVHGTSSADVWACGYRLTGDNPDPPPNFIYQSLILHYDGVTWTEQNVKTKSAVYSIYSNAPDDVWACGADGILYHYDGSGWSIDTIKINIPQNAEYNLYGITRVDSATYIMGAVSENLGAKTTYYLFKKAESTEVMDSFIKDIANPEDKWGIGKLYTTSFRKLYSIGVGVFEWTGSRWEKKIDTKLAPFRGFYETSESNMVIVGEEGQALHFNGSDWLQLNENIFKNFLLTGVWFNNNDVTIVGNLLDSFPQKTIIFHGKK